MCGSTATSLVRSIAYTYYLSSTKCSCGKLPKAGPWGILNKKNRGLGSPLCTALNFSPFWPQRAERSSFRSFKFSASSRCGLGRLKCSAFGIPAMVRLHVAVPPETCSSGRGVACEQLVVVCAVTTCWSSS